MRTGYVAFHVGYLLLLVVGFATQPSLLAACYLATCLLYVLANLRRVGSATPIEAKLLGLMVIAPAVMLVISIPRIGFVAPFHALVGVTAAFAAFFATRDLLVYRFASRCALMLSQGVVIVYLARTGLGGFPLDNLIPDHSSNGITSYLVVLQINYSVAEFVAKRRIPWPTQLTTLAICIAGFGRGSILSSAALLVTSAAAAAMGGRGRVRAAAFALIALAGVGIYRYREQIPVFLEANTKFGSGFIDSNRSLMLEEYLDRLTVIGVVVGGSYERTVIATDYNLNPHNSFIRAHHIFGLVYLAAIALLPFYAAAHAPGPLIGRAHVLFMMLILYLRAFTEPILFPTMFDFFYYGMCFLVVRLSPDARPQVVRDSRESPTPDLMPVLTSAVS